MGSDNPTHRSAAVQALGAAARRAAREFRRSVRRDAEAFRNAGFDNDRIASELELDAQTLRRLLAVDGVTRCVECAFELHSGCLGALVDDRTGAILACAFSCTSP